jgi:hypothetical protein
MDIKTALNGQEARKKLVTVHGLFETQNSKRQRSIKYQITNYK